MNRKGFTLIELLIVVVIIGILAAIAIPKFSNTKGKAYVSAMKSDLRNLVTAQESYFGDNDTYGTLAGLGTAYSSSSGVTVVIAPPAGRGTLKPGSSGTSPGSSYDALRQPSNEGSPRGRRSGHD